MSNGEVPLKIPPGAGYDIPIPPTPSMIEGGVLLPVPYIYQEPAQNLCWAACCEMTMRANNISNMRMCNIAGLLTIPPSDCCNQPTMSSECDKENYPENAYAKLNFPCDPPYDFAFNWQSLINEIQIANRPVEAWYDWNGGGAHVALLIGIHPNGYLFVNDPWMGWGWAAYQDVCVAYGEGRWSKSYQGIGYSLAPIT